MSSSTWSSSEDYQKHPSADATSSKKVFRWVALGLEVAAGSLILSLAAYIRLAHLHPNASILNWKEICSDMSLYAERIADDNDILLYVLVVVMPFVFILFGELEYLLLSKQPVSEELSKTERLQIKLPRMVKLFAIFMLGLMLSSFTADYLKILIPKPRPYFLTTYGSNCPNGPYNGDKTEDFYDSLKSFPCHLASVAWFSCMFAVGYAHRVRSVFSKTLLMPIMSQGFVMLAITASMDRYTSHNNHSTDIIGGLLIGLVLGLYMSVVLANVIISNSVKNQPAPVDVWRPMIPRISLPSIIRPSTVQV